MRVSACITTRNRTEQLAACLQALFNSNIKPHSIVVSDDSPAPQVQQKNYDLVKQYVGVTYITGPRAGVCANRNNAVNAIRVSDTDFVAFIDDDVCVEPDFIALAIARYNQMSPELRKKTILSGISKSPDGTEMVSGKLNFRGYFSESDVRETVAIHATLFPRSFFEQEQWDENIFFGYEDAELCLRALKRGYSILHCPSLNVIHIGAVCGSSLLVPAIGSLTNYEISTEAARLYVGIKRYKNLFPNFFKLIAFVVVYFIHITAYLLKRKSIQALPEIIRRSQLQKI